MHTAQFPVLSRICRPLAWCLLLAVAGCVATPGNDTPHQDKQDEWAWAETCALLGDPIVTGNVTDNDANEVSGLVMSRQHPGILWAHNDGDGKNLELFALDRTGEMLAEIKIRGVDLTDVEDVAIGPGPQLGTDYLYLADIGDNKNNRKQIQVIRVAEPALEDEEVDSDDVEVFRFEYDDDDPHDAEAIMVDPWSQSLFVITKHGPDERHTRVYQSRPFPSALTVNILDEVLRDEDAPWLEGSVVAADISADGTKVAVLFKEEATRTWQREPGESIGDVLSRPACLSPSAAGQQEALAYNADGSGYYLIPEGDDPNVFFVAQRAACPDYETPTFLGDVVSSQVEEVSGLALSRRDPRLLWAVNDSGNGDSRNVITALTTEGEHIADTEVTSIKNHDWEDIAIGPGPLLGRSYLYIADIGDNDTERSSIAVHRFLEPEPGEAPWAIETLRFAYPNDKSRDAESLLVDPITGDIFIITRKRQSGETRVYTAKAPHSADQKITLKKVMDEDDNPDLAHSIVGADVSADGLTVALIRRDGVPMLYPRHPDGPAFEALMYRGCRAHGAPGKQDAIALDRAGGFYQLGEGDDPTLFHSRVTDN